MKILEIAIDNILRMQNAQNIIVVSKVVQFCPKMKADSSTVFSELSTIKSDGKIIKNDFYT